MLPTAFDTGIPHGARDCYARKLLGGVGQMINRRRAIIFVLAVAPSAWLLQSSVASADQAFQRFIPFLVDLEGWQGKKPEGFSMETSGTNMITAAREYERGPILLRTAGLQPC